MLSVCDGRDEAACPASGYYCDWECVEVELPQEEPENLACACVPDAFSLEQGWYSEEIMISACDGLNEEACPSSGYYCDWECAEVPPQEEEEDLACACVPDAHSLEQGWYSEEIMISACDGLNEEACPSSGYYCDWEC